jgi:hypothetical protein
MIDPIPNAKTMVVWQYDEGEWFSWGHGELRKWERRPLHNGKKNFWWSEGRRGHEIEIRRMTLDPQLGFFATVEEALDRWIKFHMKKFGTSEEESLDSVIKSITASLDCAKGDYEWVSRNTMQDQCTKLLRCDFLMKSLTEQIAAAKERRALLTSTKPLPQGRDL